MSTFYITCAIDYPNSRPHLGTAYEKITADAIARFQGLMGRDVRFLMGLDEHSQKVELVAREKGMDTRAYCDEMEKQFREAWAALNVENDRFIRTSEERHARAVLEMIRRVEGAGDIYTSYYKGLYCLGCEAFYLERDLVDGTCPQHLTEPEQREEENAFFRLSRFAEPLLRHLEEHPEFVRPKVRRNEVLALLNEGLEDISISRRGEGWGIPMPGHEGQAVYVWFDALTNYLTDLGFPDDTEEWRRFWPADIHLVGKDITRFHCVIWPAMLLSAGLPLPRTVFGHGFVQRGGGRMSKTVGNVIDPQDAAATVGVDALRFFLLREAPLGRDFDFDLDRLEERYNSELANDLGNLFQRTLSMARKYREGALPRSGDGTLSTGLRELARDVEKRYRTAFGDFAPLGAIDAVWELVTAANQAIERHKPWGLAKDPASAADLDTVLVDLVSILAQIAMMLYPVMPERAAAMASQLGIDEPPTSWRLDGLDAWRERSWQVSPGEPLFPRIET